MATYKVSLQQHNQDDINYHSFDSRESWEKEFGNWLSYSEVLEYSMKKGYISDESEIESFCDGSNNVEPYFSSESAEYECQMQLEGYGVEFDQNVYRYDVSEIESTGY